MEVYYQNFISKEGSLEQLVDDLTLLVQGVDDLAAVAGSNLPPEELHPRLERLRETGRRVKEQIIAGSAATDRAMRQNPYSTAGFALAAGLLAGYLIARSRFRD